jgi:hypothetical protein
VAHAISGDASPGISGEIGMKTIGDSHALHRSPPVAFDKRSARDEFRTASDQFKSATTHLRRNPDDRQTDAHSVGVTPRRLSRSGLLPQDSGDLRMAHWLQKQADCQ